MNPKIACPFCKREMSVYPKTLKIWLHRSNGYQCPGSNRNVTLEQIRFHEKKRLAT